MEKDKKIYYASGKSFIDDKWQSCRWEIEASSFTEAAKIAENDKTFVLRTISVNAM